jgi:hypothetical protein
MWTAAIAERLVDAYLAGVRRAAEQGHLAEARRRCLEVMRALVGRGRYVAGGDNAFHEVVQAAAEGTVPRVRTIVHKTMRRELTQAFSYAVPTVAGLAAIARGGPILEVGSGAGYWARCLGELGAEVRATDREPPAVTHAPVERAELAAAIDGASGVRTLLLCWPVGIVNQPELATGAAPRFSGMGETALERYRGERLAFVGELGHRSFGSPAFYVELERQFELVELYAIPNLDHRRDAVHLFRRR